MAAIGPWRLAMVIGVVLFCAAIVAFAYVQGETTFKDSESYQHRTRDCQPRALALLPADVRAVANGHLLDEVSVYCYNDVRRADELGKSSIIRGMYIHQRYENNVILFMVVLITLAGVALAGLQLLTSYNLAATGHLQGDGATDLSLEQGTLSIKSSVTGLVVLAFSLAFFFIYIIEVYNILPASAPPSDRAPSAAARAPSAAGPVAPLAQSATP